MIGKKQFSSLKGRLLTTIIFVAIYPIILVVIVGILNYENVLKERFFQSAASEMALISNYINQDVEDMDNFMIGLLSEESIYDIIHSQEDVMTKLDEYQLQRGVEGYLRSAIASKMAFDVGGLYLYDSKAFYFTAQRTGLILREQIPYLKMEEDFSDENLKTVYMDATGIYLGRRILDKDTFKPVAMMVFRINPSHLSTIVGEENPDGITFNYMMNREGEVVAYSGNGGHKILLTNYQFYLKPQGNYEVNDRGIDYYVSVSSAKLLDFALIRLTTKDELLEDLQKVTDLILILSIVNLPLYIFIGNMLYKNIMTPVRQLVKGMERFEQGDLNVLIESKRQDEFGFMIDTFNGMTGQMKKLINEVYVEELARKDAEIAALQEQINPHFLYNTLESINWRAQIAGQDEIAAMIQALSIMMDAGINRDREKEIALSKEVFITDQYMYLVQMRYGDKMTYTKEVEEGLGQAMVPKLFLQPLMENAVKHGLEPVGRAEIKLKIWTDEKLHIEVSDTGQGMTHTKKGMIKRIFKQEEKAGATKEHRRSIGLRNVARRLHLLYGDQVHIEIWSKLGSGTTIEMVIPLRKDENYEQII